MAAESHLYFSVCPFCGRENEFSRHSHGHEVNPEDGDYSICFHCLRVGIFDSAHAGKMRKPTLSEVVEISASYELFQAIQLVKEVKKHGQYPSAKGS